MHEKNICKTFQCIHHPYTHTAGPHADVVAVVMGILFTFLILLFLITLAATGYYFIRKTLQYRQYQKGRNRDVVLT